MYEPEIFCMRVHLEYRSPSGGAPVARICDIRARERAKKLVENTISPPPKIENFDAMLGEEGAGTSTNCQCTWPHTHIGMVLKIPFDTRIFLNWFSQHRLLDIN